ncbi:N-formylglutamate amidohydrolase [Hoeflea poritis]|uniref:N-formylglutamate amidohydrolase n=1 Tax=Hoeflea poritis TaxID=2993659 RepID=A0ABT4VUD0_9HYPH|nr:N-formylglutamate amidohydrolase [Hoeflea poritis]MDA4847642.1 N-formylglutamate amidohydrolase [Hoeflea poritis]
MASPAAGRSKSLLLEGDHWPVEVVNGDSDGPVVLVCEHAGRAIPAALGDLGLPPSAMDLHIAYDIGAASVARTVAGILDAPLVLQPYSRLVIDCNRPVDAEDAIAAVSDNVEVPGNRNLPAAARQCRIDEIFEPFHKAVSTLIEGHERRAFFAIHSFTRTLAGQERKWDVGFASRTDPKTPEALAEQLVRLRPELNIGMNEPYAIDDQSDWTIPTHGERFGLQHSLVEIRNDHLRDEQGCVRWAELLGKAIGALIEAGAVR